MTNEEKLKKLEKENRKLKKQLSEAEAILNNEALGSSSLFFRDNLEKNRPFLDSMIHNLKGMVYRCRNDRDWTMEFISIGIKDLTGYPPSDFINNNNRSFNSIIHPEDRELIWEKWQKTLGKKEYFEDEYRIITSNGTVKWVWEHGCGIFENGRLTALEGFITDITEFRDTINSLKEKEELLGLIGNMAKISGWELDVATGNVRWTSDIGAYKGMNSYEEINILTGLNRYVKEDQQKVEEAIKLAVEKGIPYEMDLRIENLEGAKNWVRTKGLPVFEDGKVVRLKGIFQDITERKKALLHLEEERIRLKTLLGTIPDMIWLKDPAGVYISCNLRFESLYAATEAEIRGKTDYDFVEKDLADFFRKNDLNAIAANEPTTNYEWVTFANDGHREYLETIKTPMRDSEGNLLGVLGIARDITAKLEAEEELLKAKRNAEESDKLKTAFLQNMSHEIRTPMNAIMGFSELLPDVFDDKEQLKYYTEIINSRCDDLLQIIDGILDIAKIESGQISVFTEKCDLSIWFSDLRSFFLEYRKNIRKENVGIEFSCEHASPSVVYFDQGKVKQILINLVNNAFKFTDNGVIKVSCKCVEGNLLQFRVADTGIGIREEDQERIFERFAQVNQPAYKLSTGTGLGLAIVKGMLTSMGGKIWLESEYGKGTVFHFTVPYKLYKD